MTRQEVAKHVFARNPKLEVLYITSDNQPFDEEHKAHNQSKRLKDQSVEKFSREAKKEAGEETEGTEPSEEQKAKEAALEKYPFLGGNIKTVSEEVAKVETVEELEAISAAEEVFSAPARKGVLEAIENQRKELTEASNQKSE